jgi:hypothetical protein
VLQNGTLLARPLDDGDRVWLRNVIAREWGLPVVSISGAYDPSALQGFKAEESSQRLGVITYRIDGQSVRSSL